MGLSYRELLAEQMKDPEFKAEWEALEPEFNAMLADLSARDARAARGRKKRCLVAASGTPTRLKIVPSGK